MKITFNGSDTTERLMHLTVPRDRYTATFAWSHDTTFVTVPTDTEILDAITALRAEYTRRQQAAAAAEPGRCEVHDSPYYDPTPMLPKCEALVDCVHKTQDGEIVTTLKAACGNLLPCLTHPAPVARCAVQVATIGDAGEAALAVACGAKPGECQHAAVEVGT